MPFLVYINKRDRFFHSKIEVPASCDEHVRFIVSNQFPEVSGCYILNKRSIRTKNLLHLLFVLKCALFRTDRNDLNSKVKQCGYKRPAFNTTGVKDRLFAFKMTVWL